MSVCVSVSVSVSVSVAVSVPVSVSVSVSVPVCVCACIVVCVRVAAVEEVILYIADPPVDKENISIIDRDILIFIIHVHHNLHCRTN